VLIMNGQRERAYIREVGPRDGIQLARSFLGTARKIEWCKASVAAGLRQVEATSFVSARAIPQFADANVVVSGLRGVEGLEVAVLVPNLKGAISAFDATVHKVNFVLSASEAHNLANVHRTIEQSVQEFKAIVAERQVRGVQDSVALSATIATSFGCSLTGSIPEQHVIDLAFILAQAGADEIVLADTVGYANPGQVRRMFAALAHAVGPMPLAAHFHDTRGLGLANVFAAVDAGVRRFDASLGGLGGCPFAPGATGNINTEDCAYLLESLGFATGIDFERVSELRIELQHWLPQEPFQGAIARAGLPKSFRDIRKAA
jgi:hydroxymethylglutaryl-CoA lyase